MSLASSSSSTIKGNHEDVCDSEAKTDQFSEPSPTY